MAVASVYDKNKLNIIVFQNSENDKYKALNDGASYTNNATAEIIDSVKMGKHVYIDWKSTLKFIMRNDFIETNRCDLGIGKLSS